MGDLAVTPVVKSSRPLIKIHPKNYMNTALMREKAHAPDLSFHYLLSGYTHGPGFETDELLSAAAT
jgi:hypothetical protein